MNQRKPASRLLVGVLLALTSSCGPVSPADRPLAELPEYTAEKAAVMDDSLEPEIFGMSQAALISEELLESLVAEADQVGVVRLATVTREASEGQVRYRLQLKPQGQALLGPELDSDVEVRVGTRSSSLAMLRSLDTEAVGKNFIVFLKRYRSNGESVWHFRGLADSPSRRAAITELR